MSAGARELHRARATFALFVAGVSLAGGLALRLYPPLVAAGPRLTTPWVGGALALAIASVLAAWIARPRHAPLLTLGVLPLAAVAALVMLLLALLEPVVREVLTPAGLETAGAFTLVVAALRAVEAQLWRVVPRAPARTADAKPEAQLAALRAELARDALQGLLAPATLATLLAASSVGAAIVMVALIFARARLDVVETWLPTLAAALLATGAGSAALARAAGARRSLQAVLGAGLVVGRAKDVLALARVRRWQLDPALLAAPGPVEVLALADVHAEKLVAVAEALLSVEESPEHGSVRLARQGKGLPPAAAAALRRDRSLFRGTIEGERWYLGPERAVAELDPRALDGSMEATITFLRDKKPIVFILGTPDRGALGVVGVALGTEPRVRALAQALHATVMPGGPDGMRQALAQAAEITCDGPPLGDRDATLLAERSPPPSAGLRVRVLSPELRVGLEDDAGPRVLPADAPRLAALVPELARRSRRARLIVAAVAIAPLFLASLAHLAGLLGPTVGAGVALVSLSLAASLLRTR